MRIVSSLIIFMLFSHVVNGQFDFALYGGVNYKSIVESTVTERVLYNFATESEDTIHTITNSKENGYNVGLRTFYKMKQFEIHSGVSYYIPKNEQKSTCDFFDPEVFSTGIGNRNDDSHFIPLWSIELGTKYYFKKSVFGFTPYAMLNLQRIQGHTTETVCYRNRSGYGALPALGLMDDSGAHVEINYSSYANLFSIQIGYKFLYSPAQPKLTTNEILEE